MNVMLPTDFLYYCSVVCCRNNCVGNGRHILDNDAHACSNRSNARGFRNMVSTTLGASLAAQRQASSAQHLKNGDRTKVF